MYYQKKAWFDGATCRAWLKDFRAQAGSQSEKLLGLDNLGGQCHPDFRSYARNDCNSLLIYTPEDCTDLCAVTDAGLGKAIKDRMKAKFEKDFDERADEWVDGDISAGKS